MEAVTPEFIRRKVEEKKNSIIKLARELIRIPSITGEEGEAQSFVRDKLKEIGLKVESFEPDPRELSSHPSYFPTSSYTKYGYAGRPNVIGILREGTSEKKLILNGHIDVVPPGSLGGWRYDPWSGEVSGGRIYGRGAGDMKAGLSSIISAVELVRDLELPIDGTILVESTIEEEDGGVGGALATLLKGYRGDFSINPEPTNLDFWIASAGVLYFKIGVKGRPSHVMEPYRGVSAIDKLFLVYKALKMLDKERRKNIRFKYAERCDPNLKGYETFLNIGMISGGNWPSTVPDWAELHCRIGWPPGESVEDVEVQIKEKLSNLAESDDWFKDNPPEYEVTGWRAEPSMLNLKDLLLRELSNIASKVLGRSPRFCGGTAGLDTRFFINDFKIPSVCFGPVASNIHGFNESVEIDSILKVTEIISLFIYRFLKGS